MPADTSNATHIPAQAQSDLVKRARQEANWSIRPPEHRKIISELADRIEDLEAAAAQQRVTGMREADHIVCSMWQHFARRGDLSNVEKFVGETLEALRERIIELNVASPAVTSEPAAPFDGRQQLHDKDLADAEDRNIGMTAKAIGVLANETAGEKDG